ncbi:MAG: serine protease [Planctomycetota bacterium]
MRFVRNAFALLLLLQASNLFAQMDRRELVNLGKNATAFLRVDKAEESATAFCVDAGQGIFLTNAHSVENVGDGEEVALVLASGRPEEQTIQVSVVRRDEDADLAILQAKERDLKLTELELETSKVLQETDDVYAFGYPFGSVLAEGQDNPSVSVSTGRVNSLRYKDGKLQRIQLDATLNPGNSGGPVLNESGKVVGIVVSGIMLTGVNFAIPVAMGSKLLKSPVVTIVSPEQAPEDLYKPIQVVAVAKSVLGAQPDLRMEIHLIRAGKTTAKYPMMQENGRFIGTIPAAPNAKRKLITLRLVFDNGEVVGKTPSFNLTVDGKRLPIQGVRSIEFEESGVASVLMPSGISRSTNLPRSGTLKLMLDKQPISVPLTGVKLLEPVLDGAQDAMPGIEVVVLAGDEELMALEIGEEIESTATDVAAASTGSSNKPSGRSAEAPPIEGKARGGIASFPAPRYSQEEFKFQLPGQIANVVPAGGGRYLVIHLEKDRKLAIFDCAKVKIHGYISLANSPILYAAGMEDVLVVYPDNNLFQRFDLLSQERRLSRQLPFGGVMTAMAMGSGSYGPLLMVHSAGQSALDRLTYEFFDPISLRKSNIQFEGRINNTSYRDRIHLRSSIDGSVFGCWATSHSPTGIEAFVINGNRCKTYHEHDSTAFVLPSHDGSKVYTSSGPLLVTQLDASRTRRASKPPVFMPSTLPAYEFSFSASALGYSRSDVEVGHKLAIHMAGDKEPLITIQNVPLPSAVSFNKTDMTFDKQVWFIPQAEMLAVLKAGSDSIYIRHIDIEDLLESSDIDYLYVMSRAPNSVRTGQTFRYQVEVRSKRGGVTYSLESAPKGMSVSRSGLVTWSVPKSARGSLESVIMLVSDSSGQQKFHSFEVRVE